MVRKDCIACPRRSRLTFRACRLAVQQDAWNRLWQAAVQPSPSPELQQLRSLNLGLDEER
jgi:hypothetical protein